MQLLVTHFALLLFAGWDNMSQPRPNPKAAPPPPQSSNGRTAAGQSTLPSSVKPSRQEEQEGDEDEWGKW
jgi:hypothetical protein